MANNIEQITDPRQVHGASLNIGIGLGRAVWHRSVGTKRPLTKIRFSSDAIKNELIRLDHALAHMVDEIQTLISQHASRLPKKQTKSQQKSQAESLDILNIYLLLANDPSWKRQLRQKIQSGVSAIQATDQTLQSIQEKFGKKGAQSIWQDRMSDFEDLSCRLKRYLTGSPAEPIEKFKGSPIIVIADHIGPAELLDYERGHLVGLILGDQSRTSHATIVARSLGIPVVGGVQHSLSEINPGDFILVNGNEGCVYIRPARKTMHRFNVKPSHKKTQTPKQSLEKTPFLPSETLDGVPISLLLNAGLVSDANQIKTVGAEGIGLYRTEIPFMVRSKFPTVTEQTKLYQEILKRAGNYPIIFRTLDVSGDKVLPYLEQLKDQKSTIDQQAKHSLFNRPALLKDQLRAFVRASGGHELRIMLPMVTEVSEVQLARQMLNKEIDRERARGNLIPIKTCLGAMIEVPSLVFQLPQIFPHVDFLSVGSNDLFQFFYAIDREFPKLSNRHDVLSPTFLSLLKSIQTQCEVAQIPLGICGEMAGNPLEALALIGLGYRTLSMAAAAIPPIKNMIRNLNYQEISDYMASVCSPSENNIRKHLESFAKSRRLI
jgi:phosphotransferase system enzyme I (PtsP)